MTPMTAAVNCSRMLGYCDNTRLLSVLSLPKRIHVHMAAISKCSASTDSSSTAQPGISKQARFFPAKSSAMLPPGTFNGKVAFITGGGTGVGRGITHMLSSLGAEITIVSRKLDVIQKAADEIQSETGNKVLAFHCDVADHHNVRSVLSSCVEQLGLPHIIVNSSSGNIIAPTERLSHHAWSTVVNSSLTGTANVILDVAKRLISAKQGASFLNISAMYAQSGSGYICPSAAAKAGVDALTKSLASEWTKYGMRFNSIALGPVKTPHAVQLREDAFHFSIGTPKYEVHTHERIAVGRMGEVEEVANLATYLLSDYANYINGSVIAFDGGEHNYMSGEFNSLKDISEENWNMIEASMRQHKA